MATNPEAKQHGHRGPAELVNAGSEIAGGAVAGALGFLAADAGSAAPFGVGGAAAALALKRIGQEISERVLGTREAIRAGGVLAIAAENISRRLRDGDTLRQDGFFDAGSHARPPADEIAESILLKSQREPEERKLSYMGSLLSNIAFDPTISVQLAHQITKLAEALTYRQLCLMKLAVDKERYSLRSSDYRGAARFAKPLYQVLYEVFGLYQRGLLNFGGDAALGLTDVVPDKMTLQGLGADVFNLMTLSRIPDGDIAEVATQLA